MNNILFPTDFSDNANNALAYALELAKDTGAKLHILNSYELPYSHSGMMVSITDILKKDSEEGIEKTVKSIKENPNYANVELMTSSFLGSAINVITNYSTDNNIDLVVMGTKGASGLKEVLVGSNAQGVIQHSEVAVLAIPEEASFKAPVKIAYAADLQEIENTSIFNALLDMAKQYKSEIYIVNVADRGEELNSTEEAIEGVKLDHVFEGLSHSFYFESNENIIAGINKFAVEKDCDVVAILARKHGFFEKIFHKSVTNELAFHAKKPLFVIKEK